MKKRILISNSVLVGIIGFAICLLCITVVLSSNTSLSFLSSGILAAFGFVGFWILLPILFIFGLYLIIRKKIKKLRFDISLWGLLLIIIGLLIISSAWGAEGQKVVLDEKNLIISMFDTSEGHVFLQYNTSINFYKQIANNFAQSLKFKSGYVISNNLLGGGFVGYVLCGSLNSAITPLGTTIACWSIIGIGILLFFNRIIKKCFSSFISLFKRTPKERKIENKQINEEINEEANSENSYAQNIILSEENEEEELLQNNFEKLQPDPIVETMIENPDLLKNPDPEPEIEEIAVKKLKDLEIENFNNSHTIQRPTFNLDGENVQHDNKEANLVDNNTYDELSKPVQFEAIASNVQEERIGEEVIDDEIDDKDLVNDNNNENCNDCIEENKIDETIEKPVQEEIKNEPIEEAKPKKKIKIEYVLPSLDLLEYHENPDELTKNTVYCDQIAERLNNAFAEFKVGAYVDSYTIGPSVTRYNIKTNESVSVNAVARVMKDVTVRLGGVPCRFEDIVEGQFTSGIEIQNDIRITVGFRETLELLPNDEDSSFDIPFGKNISGQVVHAPLIKFPHMLVAGTTGSGKSIFLHSCILSLIMRNSPNRMKLLLIDPKKVEFTHYHDIPHLICPPICENSKAVVALEKLVDEMEKRYAIFSKIGGCRELNYYNKMAAEKGYEPLPFIVAVLDEYADIYEENKEIKVSLSRLCSKARGAGIHLIIATQRPSVDIIDGVIKANLGARVALSVKSYQDSTTIIGEPGAEKLLGHGDMVVDLQTVYRQSKPRIQGCMINDDELYNVCEYYRSNYPTDYWDEFMDLEDHEQENYNASSSIDTAQIKEASDDKLYEVIKSDLPHRKYYSISYIQRTFGIGFPRAGRFFNRLVNDGYVSRDSDAHGSKVLVYIDESSSAQNDSNAFNNESNEETSTQSEEETPLDSQSHDDN